MLERFGKSLNLSLQSSLKRAIVVSVCGIACSAVPSLALELPNGPLLADRSGWNQPAYYATIQSADINGDGLSDILARGPDGLHLWRGVGDAWLETTPLQDLKDANGWTNASWYSTIRSGRLRPGQSQADVLARSSDGIHVWRYNGNTDSLQEIGKSSSFRPFADKNSDTDWTLPQYYTSLLTGDIDGDGQDELIGRGKNGLEVYHWDERQGQWVECGRNGLLSDEDGFGKETEYHTLQLAKLDGFGTVLLARVPGGVQVLRWKDGHWIVVSADGPFPDGSETPGVYRSIQTFTDKTGRTWLFGLHGSGVKGSASIALYAWQPQTHSWGQPDFIPLPGRGWEQESQYLTLKAIDPGKGKIELLARTRHGLHVFTREDHTWQPRGVIRELSDAHGYGLPSTYKTLQTLHVELGQPASALLVRSPEGITVYHSVRGQLSQQTPFPSWQNANQVAAYSLLSNLIGPTYDARMTYALADNDYDYWEGAITAMKEQVGKQPANIPAADWNHVRSQLQTEFTYVAAARAWFQNNATLTSYIFNGAALQLNSAAFYEQLTSSAGGTSTALSWVSFALDLVKDVGTVLGQPEVGLVTGLLQSGIEGAASAASGGNNGVESQIAQIANKIGQVNNAYTTQNAQQITSYVTDWGMLQTIGVGSIGTNPKYLWGQGTSINELALAEAAGSKAQGLWLFKQMSYATWHTWWCYPQDARWIFGGCLAHDPYDNRWIVGDLFTDFTAYVVQLGTNDYPYFPAFYLLSTQYGVNYNDLLSACEGWNLNGQSAPSRYTMPNDCNSGDSLTQGDADVAIAALQNLRNSLGDNPSNALTAPLDAGIRYIQQHKTWQPAPNGGAPSNSDIAHALADGQVPYVDKRVPLQFLSFFMRTVEEEKKRGLDPQLGDSFLADAYAVSGQIGSP